MSLRTTGVAAFAALLGAAPSGSAESATRILDRTVVCRTIGTGYPDPVRVMNVSAAPRLGSFPPSVDVFNGPSGDGVRASIRTGPFGPGTGAAVMSKAQCSPTTMRLRLASTGLRGGQTELGERYQCNVPARVLIRVRALFNRPVRWRPENGSLVATGRIATGYVAVAALPRRKPIFFASVSDASGKASIFVAQSGCVPNR